MTKRDSLITFASECGIGDLNKVNLLTFYKTFPTDSKSLNLLYGSEGTMEEYTLFHLYLFFQALTDSSIVSKEEGLNKYLKLIPNFNPRGNNLDEFYIYTGKYFGYYITTADLITHTSYDQRNSIFRFMSQFWMLKDHLKYYAKEPSLTKHSQYINTLIKGMKSNK